MGNRAECPACKAYTSDVYNALNYSFKNCPYCDASYEILQEWNILKEKLDQLQEKRISKDLINDLEITKEKNYLLTSIIEKLENEIISTETNYLNKYINILRIMNSYKRENEFDIAIPVSIKFLIDLVKDKKISISSFLECIKEVITKSEAIEILEKNNVNIKEEFWK